MALGLQNGNGDGGSFLPIAKYDARAGRLFRVDRNQRGDGSWQSDNVDITQPAPQFAIDMGSIEVGWLTFTATGPSFKLVPFGTVMPEKPTPEHKAGFRVKLGGKIMGGVREFAASAKCVLSAIDELHTAFELAPEAAAGKIPLVKMSGTKPVVSKGPQATTTNYAPIFEIVGWVDRLQDMGERTVEPPKGPLKPAPARPTASATPPANHAPPPSTVDWDTDGMPDFETGKPRVGQKAPALVADDVPF